MNQCYVMVTSESRQCAPCTCKYLCQFCCIHTDLTIFHSMLLLFCTFYIFKWAACLSVLNFLVVFVSLVDFSS